MSVNMLPQPDKRGAVAAYAKEHLTSKWINVFLILMKNVTGSLLYMVPPFLSKYVLETLLPQKNWNLLVIVTVCMVAAPITGSMMIILENMWGRFIIRVSGRGRADLYNGIQNRSMEWLRSNKSGDLLTRMLDDTRSITDLVNGRLGFMLFHVVTITVGSAILLVLEPGMASIVLVLWIGQAVLMTKLGKHVKQRAADTARHNSLVAETVRELVSGAAFIKAAGKETQALANVRACLDQEWDHTRRGVRADHKARMIHTALDAFILVLMYSAGGWFVLHDQLTLGSLVAFVAVYNWLRPFGIQLIQMVFAAMKVIPSIDRVTEIAFPAHERKGGVIPEGLVTLEAQRVSFRYDSRTALSDVSFRIAPGSIVSIVGHRGSGKSTLADLLLGLREPASGIVSFSDIPLVHLDPSWLRRHVLCVTQDVMLRSGTIHDNIIYGSDEVGMEAVHEAVRTAELEEWISRLPDGLHTVVGEQALQISGGERQRISIARAILRKPDILILDEATSSLDQGTERRLLEGLIRDLKGTTLIFITHRLEIALRSDEILVMDNGRLAERGDHAELISRPSIYRELWAAQGAGGKE
ncbi:ABC transporter ATP-binding protein [Paenibacillus tarimensis]